MQYPLPVEYKGIKLDCGFHLPKKNFQTELNKIWELFPELEQRKKQNSGKLSGGKSRCWR